MEISSSFRLCCAYQLSDLSYPERTSQFYPRKKGRNKLLMCSLQLQYQEKKLKFKAINDYTLNLCSHETYDTKITLRQTRN